MDTHSHIGFLNELLAMHRQSLLGKFYDVRFLSKASVFMPVPPSLSKHVSVALRSPEGIMLSRELWQQYKKGLERELKLSLITAKGS